jgi:hypothetical protein
MLRWQAGTDPTFYSCEVAKDDQTTVVSPEPLRAALWVDVLPTTIHSQCAALLRWCISHWIHFRVILDRSRGVNSASGTTGCFLF